VARVHRTFTVALPPERAQELFTRDILPDADPDEFEAHDEEAGEPVLADVLRRGTDAETAASVGDHASPSFELAASHRLKVTFEPDGGGTKLTIKGSSHDDVRKGLEQLGTHAHWPETADQPHG
jgi:hypothetical protein